jgi:hypothetical protein
MKTNLKSIAPTFWLAASFIAPGFAQTSAPSGEHDLADIGKKLQNPIASLISIKIHFGT